MKSLLIALASATVLAACTTTSPDVIQRGDAQRLSTVVDATVLSVRPDMQVRYCARLFENFGISHAPVVEDGNAIGMVSYYRLVLQGILPELEG